VILHRYVEYPSRLYELLCNDSVISRRRWIAARVIVDENYRRGIFRDCFSKHLTRMNERRIQKSACYRNVPLQPMLGIEDSDVKFFHWKILQSLSEDFVHIARASDGNAFVTFLSRHATAELECSVHRNRSRIANSAEARERGDRLR